MKKKAAGAKAKVAPARRAKKTVPKKRARSRWHEEAVIHQDMYFAEAPMQP